MQIAPSWSAPTASRACCSPASRASRLRGRRAVTTTTTLERAVARPVGVRDLPPGLARHRDPATRARVRDPAPARATLDLPLCALVHENLQSCQRAVRRDGAPRGLLHAELQFGTLESLTPQGSERFLHDLIARARTERPHRRDFLGTRPEDLMQLHIRHETRYEYDET